MNERLYTVAAAPFEAARQVDILPAGHRARRLHGHSFLARVRAELPPEWAPFRGGETDALAERLRAAVQAHAFPVIGSLTVSIGVAEYLPGDTNAALMERADQALYRAKALGRNAVQRID